MLDATTITERNVYEVMTPTQAARGLGISRQAVQQAIRLGRIKAMTIPGARTVFCNRHSVVEYGLSTKRPPEKQEHTRRWVAEEADAN